MGYFKLYIVAFLIFFVIDMLWLTVIGKSLYQQQIGFLMADEIRWGAAVLFYLLYLVGLLVFAIMPAIKEGQASTALFHGALLGLVCYATYDLTNLATLKNWPMKIVFYDLLWGTFLSAITALATFWIYTRYQDFFDR